MRKFILTLSMLASLFSSAIFCCAQDTNVLVLYTRLENFDARIGSVIVKGTAPMGSFAARGGTVSVWCKESQDVSTSERESGIAVGIREDNHEENVTMLDYEELDSFLFAIDFVARVDVQVTTLPDFHAGYTSRSGLKISAYTSNRNAGSIQVTLQSSRLFKSRVVLDREHLAKLKITIQEAKVKLDTLKPKKNGS